MSCNYCGYGDPLFHVLQKGHVEYTFINKRNQFCICENEFNSHSKRCLSINYCPYCGEQLYKDKENITVNTKWYTCAAACGNSTSKTGSE